MRATSRHEPFFVGLPTVVVWMLVVIIAISALALVGPDAVRGRLLAAFAVLTGEYASGPRPLGAQAPYALHVLLHGSWLHLGLNMAVLMSFGAIVARRLGHTPAGVAAFLAFFAACSVAGAAAQVWVFGGETQAMIGASSGLSGVIAGAVYVYRAQGPYLPAPWSSRYLVGLAPWVAINLAIAAFGGSLPGVGAIAWAAHLGGMAAGVVLFPLAHWAAWSQNTRS